MTTNPVGWQRYVAIGDSFTEGMSDADPDHPNRYVGWADRLARHLAEVAGGDFAYANLAVRGRLLADVIGPQLESALNMSPDLVSMVGGGNNLLRPRVDLDAMAAQLDDAAAKIRATGADLLLATPLDTLESGVFKGLRARHAIHTANLFSIAQRHGCYVLNLWAMESLRDWRLWAPDRIHLTSEGHRRVALNALATLGHPHLEDPEQMWRERLPAPPAVRRRERLAEHGTWAKEYVAPWVQRRLQGRSSGDAVTPKRPDLRPLD